MKYVLNRIAAINDHFSGAIARVTAWRMWMTLLTVGTVVWIVADAISHDRIDPGKTLLVLILTIQTSLDSQGQRLNQAEQRKIDEKHDEQWMHQLTSTAELTVAIKAALDRSEEHDSAAKIRDEDTVVRDIALFEVVKRLVDILEILEEPVDPDKWAAILARVKALPPTKKAD